MNDTKQCTEDLAMLEQLNPDYNQADHAGDPLCDRSGCVTRRHV
jgi:hypothetical protein